MGAYYFGRKSPAVWAGVCVRWAGGLPKPPDVIHAFMNGSQRFTYISNGAHTVCGAVIKVELDRVEWW